MYDCKLDITLTKYYNISREEVNIKIYKDQKIGAWTASRDQEFSTKGYVKVECRCVCGFIKMVSYHDAIYEKTKSCGCNRIINRRKTNKVKYGHINCLASEYIKKQIKKTSMRKYKTARPCQSKIVKDKIKKTNLRRRGVTNPRKDPKVIIKIQNKRDMVKIQEKMRKTCLKRYGVEWGQQSTEIALKTAKKQNYCYIEFHWKTKQELICKSSYEAKVVRYLNSKQIDYTWQPRTFKLSTRRTYRPDLYLIQENKWIEIKGRWFPGAREKWNEFHIQICPNSELWDQQKLKKLGIL